MLSLKKVPTKRCLLYQFIVYQCNQHILPNITLGDSNKIHEAMWSYFYETLPSRRRVATSDVDKQWHESAQAFYCTFYYTRLYLVWSLLDYHCQFSVTSKREHRINWIDPVSRPCVYNARTSPAYHGRRTQTWSSTCCWPRSSLYTSAQRQVGHTVHNSVQLYSNTFSNSEIVFTSQLLTCVNWSSSCYPKVCWKYVK